MFKNIAVAYDESPEAGRALTAAIHLARTLGVGLQSITVMDKLPAYTAFATGADPAMMITLEEDRAQYYAQMQDTGRAEQGARASSLQPICWTATPWKPS